MSSQQAQVEYLCGPGSCSPKLRSAHHMQSFHALQHALLLPLIVLWDPSAQPTHPMCSFPSHTVADQAGLFLFHTLRTSSA
jgi:hypothetical protein